MFRAVATLPMQKVEKSTWFEFIRKMLFVGCKFTKSFAKLLHFTVKSAKRPGEDGSGDSLAHFFIDALDDPIAYSSEFGELANDKPTPERRLKDRISLFSLECLNGTDIRIRASD